MWGEKRKTKLSCHVGLGGKFRHNSRRNILTDEKVSFFLGTKTTERFTRKLFYTFLNQVRWVKSLIIMSQKWVYQPTLLTQQLRKISKGWILNQRSHNRRRPTFQRIFQCIQRMRWVFNWNSVLLHIILGILGESTHLNQHCVCGDVAYQLCFITVDNALFCWWWLSYLWMALLQTYCGFFLFEEYSWRYSWLNFLQKYSVAMQRNCEKYLIYPINRKKKALWGGGGWGHGISETSLREEFGQTVCHIS